MKFIVALLAVASAAIVVNAQTAARGQAPAPPKPVTSVVFIDKDKVATTFAKGGNFINAPDMVVLGVRRDVPGQVEVHDKETDIMYILDGSATIVTGGKMEGGKVSRPGQWLGTSITGGQSQRLTKGDMMIVPAGIPHWFKEITPPQINYYVVKVVKP